MKTQNAIRIVVAALAVSAAGLASAQNVTGQVVGRVMGMTAEKRDERRGYLRLSLRNIQAPMPRKSTFGSHMSR